MEIVSFIFKFICASITLLSIILVIGTKGKKTGTVFKFRNPFTQIMFTVIPYLLAPFVLFNVVADGELESTTINIFLVFGTSIAIGVYDAVYKSSKGWWVCTLTMILVCIFTV